ncbi:MAG TPA: hypothetical protein VI423_00745 [Paenisporosarcina sp.]|nr:hypothetical protein [Paenisporosarcina sp.]
MEDQHVHGEHCNHGPTESEAVDPTVVLKGRSVGATTLALDGAAVVKLLEPAQVEEVLLTEEGRIKKIREERKAKNDKLRRKRKSIRAKALRIARNKEERRNARRGATAKQILAQRVVTKAPRP